MTGIFFKLPVGALSDIIGRKRSMLIGLVVFTVMPFTYLLVHDYRLLVIVRFIHGLATAVYGPAISERRNSHGDNVTDSAPHDPYNHPVG